MKRAHGDSIVNDDVEQLETRAGITALFAGLHGVNVAEDDEVAVVMGSQMIAVLMVP